MAILLRKISPELQRQLKIRAAREGKTIEALTIELILLSGVLQPAEELKP